MARVEKTVFISYRRKDISWALAVYQYLTSQKYDVFFDFSSIPSGDFEQIIISNIKARAHFILILTPTALDRTSNEGDWLRGEIETAIDEKRNIIPLFFDGFSFGLPNIKEKLTGKMSNISRYNGLDVPSGYFPEAMERLRTRYLNVPLDAILHPVSTEVRKKVKEEKVAANKALRQQKDDFQELVKQTQKKPEQQKQPANVKGLESPTPGERPTSWFNKIDLRTYGIGIGVLFITVLGIFGVNSLVQKLGKSVSPLPTNTIETTSTLEQITPTNTMVVDLPTPTVDPTGQTVNFWHFWGTALLNETMLAIVDDFNSSNEWGITVRAIDQGNYNDLEDAFNAAVQAGDLPDLVTGYTFTIANWYAVDSVVDLTPYITDSFFGLTDAEKAAFYEGVINGGKAADGTVLAFPVIQSQNVLFYNSSWAKEIGFDYPPSNYAEFKEQACAATVANNVDDNPDNDGTGGLVLYVGASNVASFVFANGGDMQNAAGNGYDFTDQTVVDTADFMKDLWDNECAYPTESYPNLEFATRKALFTMSSTAGLPYQIAAFDAEDAIKDDWMIIPFPGKDGGQSVNLFGQYVAIANTNPERMMATWIFIKYLTSPETQAKWIKGSAYYPVRSDAVPPLDSYGNDNPIWFYGLSFLQYGKAEPAWASWTTVRRDVGDTFNSILQGTPDQIPSLLDDLNVKAQQAIEETQ